MYSIISRVCNKKAKYIEIHFYTTRYIIRDKKISIFYKNTKDNIVNFFTKPLNPNLFNKFKKQLGLKYYNSKD